jgi:4'-phosphopantetheinyl transferase
VKGYVDPTESENQTGGDIFYFEVVDRAVDLCFVHIPKFSEACLPGMWSGSVRTEKSVVISRSPVLREFLCGMELETVNRFRTLKKQVEWLSGRFAIKKLMAKDHPSGIHEADIQVDYTPQGAPFISSFADFGISITHSNDWAVAAVIRKKGHRIGIDLEKIAKIDMDAVMAVAFSEKEKLSLDGASPEALFRAWTRKEAFLKYLGKGFHESLKHVEILGDAVIFMKKPMALKSFSRQVCGDYFLSVVY